MTTTVALPTAALRADLRSLRDRVYTRATRVPLAELDGWCAEPDAMSHRSGKFFRVEGLDVSVPGGSGWHQPIINQPETGVLGLLVRRVDGVLHGLVQLKPEPGNCNGIQLSPTVQATRSNYTGVHRGASVPYLERFLGPERDGVLVDTVQSEHGSWFLRKGNRNMVVETGDDVEPLTGFVWLTLAQLHRLLVEDDLVNMDLRSVLACLLGAEAGLVPVAGGDGFGGDGFGVAAARSFAGGRALHSFGEVAAWIGAARGWCGLSGAERSLGSLEGWHREDDRITRRDGRYFDIIGVRVEAAGREVGEWCQPMLAPHGTGLVAFYATRVDGVLHVLASLRDEPGCRTGPEIAPTVACTPENHAHLPAAQRPEFLDAVLAADPADIRFDAVLSDEGGRFHHARSRHVVVETGWFPAPPSFRWVTLHQLARLGRQRFVLNMQARSALVCLSPHAGWAPR